MPRIALTNRQLDPWTFDGSPGDQSQEFLAKLAEHDAALDALDQAAGLGQGALFVDLTLAPWSIVAGSTAAAIANTAGMNAAVAFYTGLRRKLVLPAGDIYFEQDGTNNWSVKLNRTTNLEVTGQGMYATRCIQQGVGDFGDWHLFVLEGTEYVTFSHMTLMQGTIDNPESGQHQHLMHVTTNGSYDNVGTVGHHLLFGKCLGDGLAFLGANSPWVVRDATFTDIFFRSNGLVHASRGGARACITLQRGYSHILIARADLYGAQNSPIDMESTGDNTMEYACFIDCYINNLFGSTAIAMSFSGVGAGGRRTQHPCMINCTIRAGALYVIATDDALCINCRFIIETVLPNEPTHANIMVRQINNGLRFVNCTVQRLAGASTGLVVDINNLTTGTTTWDGGYIEQATPADIVSVEGSSRFRLINDPLLVYGGASPTTKSALRFFSNVTDVTLMDVDMTVVCTSGVLRDAVRILTRSPRSLTNVSLKVKCAGFATNGAYLSKGAGSTLENPRINIDNPGNVVWKQVDENDATITTIFPIVGGNRGDFTLHVGHATPEGELAANQGSECVLRNGDSTAKYRKTSGVSTTGWVTP